MLLHPRAVGSKLKLVGGSTAPGREGAGGCQVRAPSCAAKGVAVWRALAKRTGYLNEVLLKPRFLNMTMDLHIYL